MRYHTKSSYNTAWSASTAVPGTGYSDVWYPSLATYNNTDYPVNLIYGLRFSGTNKIYSKVFNQDGSGTWSASTALDWIGSNNRMPSIAVDNSGNTLTAWSGWNGSRYTIRHRKGLSYWSKEWQISGYNSFHPVLTYYNRGGSSPYGIDILWHTSNNQIRQVRYNGNGTSDVWLPAYPGTQLIASSGLFANVTHERQNTILPKQTWTDQTTSPIYSIFHNSALGKESAVANLTEGEIRRAAIIGDPASNSSISIEISQPVIKLSNGESKVIPFKEYDYSVQPDLSLSNIFDYLQTEITDIPGNAESISFNLEVKTFQQDTLPSGSLNENKISSFNDITISIPANDAATQSNLANLNSQRLSELNGLHNFSRTFEVNATALKNRNVFIIPKVEMKGSFDEKDLQFSLVNISIDGLSELPKEIASKDIISDKYFLEQNYPNPFNPSTTIHFQIPDDGIVSLKIYDLLGAEIKELINEFRSKGRYEIKFDASELSSGIYFYRLNVSNSGGGEIFNASRKLVLMK